MRIYAIQPDITWENPPATFAHIRSLLEHTRITPGSLIVLPEMFATGFSMHVANIAQREDKTSEAFLKEVAVQYQCAVIGGVVNLTANDRGLNQALAISPQGQELLLRYDKIHPFSYGHEPEHYAAGQAVRTFDHDGWRIAPLVCYDLRFPEIFRMAAGRGATLLVVIANWPASRIDHWQTLLKARAIENQAYVVGVNRTGNDPQVAYNGQSAIIDPKGRVLAQGHDQPAVVEAEIDAPTLQVYRAKFTALADMKYPWRDDALASDAPASDAPAGGESKVPSSS